LRKINTMWLLSRLQGYSSMTWRWGMINSRFVSGILGTLSIIGIVEVMYHQASQPVKMTTKAQFIEVVASIPVLQRHSAACPFVVDHEWGWGANVSEQMLHSRCWEPV